MPIESPHHDEATRLAEAIARGDDPPNALERLATLAGVDPPTIQQARRDGLCHSGASGRIDANVIVLMLPRADAERLLPVGLELAPNPVAPAGKHPVFFQIAQQSFDALGGLDYPQVMVGVPFVQLTAFNAPRRGPFIYMPRLYLEAVLPRELGNHLYGFEQLAAEVQLVQPGEAPGQAKVVDDSGAAVLEATMTADGKQAAPGEFASFATLRQLFEMPTISQASRIWNDDAFGSEHLSPMLATNLVYDFDDASAWLRPQSTILMVQDGLTPPGIPTGEYASPSLEQSLFGSFRISCPQKVSLPGDPATVRYPVPAPATKQRVLVLGSGPSACAAAYWLAKQTERYEVSMYTLGWRMGGKCAAGRNPAAAMRIEEHGLHAFLGFYENAIRTVRDAFDTAGIPIADGDDPLGGAFLGSTQNGLMIDVNGGWKYFQTPLPINDRVPGYVPPEARQDDGDGLRGSRPVISAHDHGLGRAMVAVFGRLVHLTTALAQATPEATQAMNEAARERMDPSALEGLRQGIRERAHELRDEARAAEERLLGGAEHHIDELLRRFARYVENVAVRTFERWIEEGPDGPLKPLLRLCKLVRTIADDLVDHFGANDHFWYLWMSISTLLTVVIGIIEERVSHLDQLDTVDTWAFLKRNGLDPRLLPEGLRDQPVQGGQKHGSPAVQAVYETLFAHGKEPIPRDMAASVGLRWLLLSGFGYAGYPAYEFKYSCPQTLLTPYYKALTGALHSKIHFFHQVQAIEVEGQGDDAAITRVRLRKQATVEAGAHAYDPFLPDPPPSNPADLPPWPNEPNYDQLVEGEALKAQGIDLESPWSPWPGVEDVVLEQGKDFDICVLGISLGALPPLTESLWKEDSPTHDPRWTQMINDVAVTQTISMQLWFDATQAELYPGERGLLTGYELPEPSMANFTHLVQWEGWGADPPKFLAYHTGSTTAKSPLDHPPFSDHEYPARANAEWLEQARQWTQQFHANFYSSAPSDWAGFTALLRVPPGGPADDPFAAQYFNAAVNMSDRYVLSQPVGMPARLGQCESGVRNLFLCGDWTRTDVNAGSVEAATQSGMLCARGISQHPVYIWHPGF